MAYKNVLYKYMKAPFVFSATPPHMELTATAAKISYAEKIPGIKLSSHISHHKAWYSVTENCLIINVSSALFALGGMMPPDLYFTYFMVLNDYS